MKAWIPEAFIELPYPVARYHVHQRDSNDCGPYCVAMVANALYEGPFVNAAMLAAELDQRGFPERIPGWATLPWGAVASLRRLGLRARWRVGTSLKRLFVDLHQNCMTIVIVGEPLHFVGRQWQGWSHYKIFVAWQPDRGLGFVDPFTARADGMTWQPLDEFRRQWAWMGKQIIEVWRV